ncbi:hypothetical protein GCM10017591_03170 [Microbacterium dextranolyticum]|uniref:Uncharacterized protein n=1 Tax=Microbacterium dextranolyticum TaxID=36806 RepID=A0A9W6HK76_9MICO|nr:hypothetical protein GCM10017591_03170 [Microbacterium dextranolyticum]
MRSYPSGRSRPLSGATRVEVAEALGPSLAGRLARGAAHAVFAQEAPTAEDAAAFWRIVETGRCDLAPTRGDRVRSAVSLRSFVHGSRHRFRSAPRGGAARDDARRTA